MEAKGEFIPNKEEEEEGISEEEKRLEKKLDLGVHVYEVRLYWWIWKIECNWIAEETYEG